VKKFTALAIFQDKETDLIPLPYFVELDDVGMILKKDKILN
jgi:hypothetical protein